MDEKPEIMTLEEVAAYLRVSERTVYEWAQKGEIPAGKIGTVWRFKRNEIQEWVNNKISISGVVHKDSQPVFLKNVLTPERVLILSGKKKNDALEALIDVMAASQEVKSRDELADGIYYRESLMSTGIGMGIAVPHVRLASIKDIIAAVAVCPEGLSDYESMDGQPVKLIFMIAARKDQQAQHLKILASISSSLKDGTLKDALLKADSVTKCYELLTH